MEEKEFEKLKDPGLIGSIILASETIYGKGWKAVYFILMGIIWLIGTAGLCTIAGIMLGIIWKSFRLIAG